MPSRVGMTGGRMETVRRQNKLKRIRRKRNKRIITVCSVLGSIFIAVLAFFTVFHVKEVKIAGNTRYSDEMILQYVQDDFVLTNTVLASWFRKSIPVEDIPFMESLDIEVLNKNTIRIYVNEKQIVGYVVDNEQKLFFDKNGYVLEIMSMTEAEIQSVQEELGRFELLRMEEEGMLPETGTPDGENPDGETPDQETSDQETPNEENPDGATSDEGNMEAEGTDLEPTEGALEEESEESNVEVEAPQVPWIFGLDMQELSADNRIIVGDSSVFNTLQGIWRISSKYKVIPERVLLDEEYNITLVYQKGMILCQLGPDLILEEKITRVAAIMENLVDKVGILHLEEYDIGTEGIIFSQESEYTVMSKINRFLQKNS